jgi:hypothetical protein
VTKSDIHEPKTPALSWETDVRLITHPLMLANFAKLFAITAFIMGALLSFLFLVTGETRSILPMLEMVGIIIAGLAVLSFLICLVVFRNRMRMRFRLDAKAAEVEMTDTRAKTANKIAVVAGILSGKPGLAGAGLLAQANTQQKAVWGAIARAHYHPAWRAITLSNGWRTVVTLYCTPENYDAVAAAVRDALAARPAGVKRKLRDKKNPLPKLLLHTALIVVACVPLFGLPDLDETAILPALLTLCFATATLWLVPVMAWAVFLGLGWLAVLELLAQSETRTSMFDGTSYRAYEVMSGDDYALIVAAALGAAYLIWLCVGLMRGRVRSALAGDMEEMEGE